MLTPDSRDAASRLDALLAEYSRREGTPFLSHLSLAEVSEFARNHPMGGRIFDYAVELQVQITILRIDLSGIRRGTEITAVEGLSVEDHFCQSMALVRMNSDYVVRYRAVWDKVMGLLVLLVAPDEFKSFDRAKSRRTAFRKIADRSGQLPEALVDQIENITKEFNDRYRTAEVHGSGSTRRWVTAEAVEWGSDQANMYWAWNALNHVLVALGSVLRAEQPGSGNEPRSCPPAS